MSFNDRFTNIDITPFLKEVHQFHRKEFPRVVRSALTSHATLTETYAKRNIEAQFTLRNKYTLGSIRSVWAKGNNISNMFSEVGSLQGDNPHTGYMAIQEHGGKTKTKALTGNEARVRKDHKKVTRKKVRLKEIGDLPKFQGGNIIGQIANFSRNGDRVKYAVVDGDGFTRGVYAITRLKRRPKKRAPFKIRMMYSLKKNSYEVSKTPWLMPAAQKAMSPAKLFRTYDEAMKKNVKNYSNGNIR